MARLIHSVTRSSVAITECSSVEMRISGGGGRGSTPPFGLAGRLCLTLIDGGCKRSVKPSSLIRVDNSGRRGESVSSGRGRCRGRRRRHLRTPNQPPLDLNGALVRSPRRATHDLKATREAPRRARLGFLDLDSRDPFKFPVRPSIDIVWMQRAQPCLQHGSVPRSASARRSSFSATAPPTRP